MKNKKRRLEPYSFYDHTGIASHLEKMALKGWMIEKITNWGWVYRRMTPASLSFAVCYYPRASEFDPGPDEEQAAFYDFCVHTGWHLACTSAQMQIFYNENPAPVPIETDPALELETLHKAAKKNFLPAYIVLMAFCLLVLSLFAAELTRNPAGIFSSSSNLFSGFAYTMCLILCLAEIGGYYRWRKKALRAAQYGEFLPVSGHSRLTQVILYLTIAGFILWVLSILLSGNALTTFTAVIMVIYITVLIALVNGVKQLLKHRGISAGINRTLTIVSSFVLSFIMMGIIIFIVFRFFP